MKNAPQNRDHFGLAIDLAEEAQVNAFQEKCLQDPIIRRVLERFKIAYAAIFTFVESHALGEWFEFPHEKFASHDFVDHHPERIDKWLGKGERLPIENIHHTIYHTYRVFNTVLRGEPNLQVPIELPRERYFGQVEIFVRSMYNEAIEWVLNCKQVSFLNFLRNPSKKINRFSPETLQRDNIPLDKAFEDYFDVLQASRSTGWVERVEKGIRFDLVHLMERHKPPKVWSQLPSTKRESLIEKIVGDQVKLTQDIVKGCSFEEFIAVLTESMSADTADLDVLSEYMEFLPWKFGTILELGYESLLVKPIIINQTLIGGLVASCKGDFLADNEEMRAFRALVSNFSLPTLFDQLDHTKRDLARKIEGIKWAHMINGRIEPLSDLISIELKKIIPIRKRERKLGSIDDRTIDCFLITRGALDELKHFNRALQESVALTIDDVQKEYDECTKAGRVESFVSKVLVGAIKTAISRLLLDQTNQYASARERLLGHNILTTARGPAELTVAARSKVLFHRDSRRGPKPLFGIEKYDELFQFISHYFARDAFRIPEPDFVRDIAATWFLPKDDRNKYTYIYMALTEEILFNAMKAIGKIGVAHPTISLKLLWEVGETDGAKVEVTNGVTHDFDIKKMVWDSKGQGLNVVRWAISKLSPGFEDSFLSLENDYVHCILPVHLLNIRRLEREQ